MNIEYKYEIIKHNDLYYVKKYQVGLEAYPYFLYFLRNFNSWEWRHSTNNATGFKTIKKAEKAFEKSKKVFVKSLF